MNCEKTGKLIHVTKDAAWVHIRSLKKSGSYAADLHAYRCDDHWHVGHSKVRLNRRIRRSIRRGKR